MSRSTGQKQMQQARGLLSARGGVAQQGLSFSGVAQDRTEDRLSSPETGETQAASCALPQIMRIPPGAEQATREESVLE